MPLTKDLRVEEMSALFVLVFYPVVVEIPHGVLGGVKNSHTHKNILV